MFESALWPVLVKQLSCLDMSSLLLCQAIEAFATASCLKHLLLKSSMACTQALLVIMHDSLTLPPTALR